MAKKKEDETVQLTKEEAEALKYKDRIRCRDCKYYKPGIRFPRVFCRPEESETKWDPINGLVRKQSTFISRIQNRKGDCVYYEKK